MSGVFFLFFGMFYHRKSIRLSQFDYTSPGYYFVTFFVKNRIQCLSKIQSASIYPTVCGRLLLETIARCLEDMPFTQISDIAIMPDHVHFIVSLENPDHKPSSTKYALRISPISGSLGSIIRTIKSISARRIRKVYPSFAWHRNYYERIVRDEVSLHNVRRYIALNPRRWEEKRQSG